jgi:hypothetical protein
MAVSDVSFKDAYGMAAWVLKGKNKVGRINGRVISMVIENG